MTYLYQKNYSTNTIRTFVSAISYFHKILNYPDPSTSFLIAKTFRGLQILKPAQDSRLPISRPLLHLMIDTIDIMPLSYFHKLLYKSMFLLAFYALCRISELTKTPSNHSLQYHDLQLLHGPERIIVTFRTFKHSTSKESVSIHSHLPHKYCPVAMIKLYLANRPINGPHDLFITEQCKPVPRLRFTQVLKQTISACQRDPELYKSHSFRIGGATYAAQLGLSPLQIQRLGRWHSNAFLKYLRW